MLRSEINELMRFETFGVGYFFILKVVTHIICKRTVTSFNFIQVKVSVLVIIMAFQLISIILVLNSN